MFNNKKKRNDILQIASFILLTISTSFNFKQYIYKNKLLLIIPYTETLDLKPSLISTLLSILLFGGFIARNLKEIMDSNVKLLFMILDLLFFSGLISVFVRSKDNCFGFSPQAILLLIIVLMYLGMRSLIRYLLISFITLTFFHISHVNDAMGFDGCIYMLFAFISFLIQLYLNILPKNKNESITRDFFGEKKAIFGITF
jgi:hypothetical protein